jgi:hypothetical protein
MPKKREETNKLDALVDALFIDEVEPSEPEAGLLLKAAGLDLGALRRRLRDKAQQLAAFERKAGRAAPPYLARAADAFSHPEGLPHDPQLAAVVARSQMAALRSPVPVSGSTQFAIAHRGLEGGLTESDQKVLSELEEDLKRDIEQDDEQKP